MSLAAQFRRGLAALDRVFTQGGFKVTLQHERFTGLGTDGMETYAAPVEIEGYFSEKAATRVGSGGRWQTSTVPAFTVIGAVADTLGVRDKLLLPNGQTVIVTGLTAGTLPGDERRLSVQVFCG